MLTNFDLELEKTENLNLNGAWWKDVEKEFPSYILCWLKGDPVYKPSSLPSVFMKVYMQNMSKFG